jgi:hypothetical protein
VSVHGAIALADAMRTQSVPLSELSKLSSTVTINEDGTERQVDFFSYDNPLWITVGVLTLAPDKTGNSRKTLRMSFQSRRAMRDALKARLGL